MHSKNIEKEQSIYIIFIYNNDYRLAAFMKMFHMKHDAGT